MYGVASNWDTYSAIAKSNTLFTFHRLLWYDHATNLNSGGGLYKNKANYWEHVSLLQFFVPQILHGDFTSFVDLGTFVCTSVTSL